MSNIRRPLKFLTLTVIFLAAAAGYAGSETFMYSEGTAEPGSVLQININSNKLDNMVLSLVNNQDRAISRSEGFICTKKRNTSIVLLGIPSNAAPGNYTLVLTANEGRSARRMEKPFRVTPKEFPEQVINMNKKMNTLFSDESEKKKEESRVFWKVITSFDPGSQYHFNSFIRPLNTNVPTAGFGDRRRYVMPNGSESTSIHKGSDFWAKKGTTVFACGRGRIVMARKRIITGNTVIIEHLPGVYSLYYHMDSLKVREGQMVKQKDPIGTVGDTGFATGEHLHWEMRVGGTPVNPEEFLEKPLIIIPD